MAAAYQPPATDDRGPLVIRPSVGTWQMGLFAIAALVLISGSLKLFGRSEKLSWFAAMLGICGLYLAVYGLYLAAYVISTRITVTADAILVTHWFWWTSTVNTRDIARVVRCSVKQIPTGGHATQVPSPVIFAFSARGRCVLSLYADRWSQADLDRIWHHLGVVPEGSWSDAIEDLELREKFPGAF
jgi:hypothetical protein